MRMFAFFAILLLPITAIAQEDYTPPLAGLPSIFYAPMPLQPLSRECGLLELGIRDAMRDVVSAGTTIKDAQKEGIPGYASLVATVTTLRVRDVCVHNVRLGVESIVYVRMLYHQEPSNRRILSWDASPLVSGTSAHTMFEIKSCTAL